MSPPPDPPGPPDWGGVIILNQAEYDALTADSDIADAWRALPGGTNPPNAWLQHLGQHEDPDTQEITYRGAHPSLRWRDVGPMLHAANNGPARQELKAERAKGGNWKRAMRTKARARQADRPQADRDADAETNRTRRHPKRRQPARP